MARRIQQKKNGLLHGEIIGNADLGAQKPSLAGTLWKGYALSRTACGGFQGAEAEVRC